MKTKDILKSSDLEMNPRNLLNSSQLRLSHIFKIEVKPVEKVVSIKNAIKTITVFSLIQALKKKKKISIKIGKFSF